MVGANMNSLKLTQVTNDGRKKIWRLSNANSPVTFGTSRKANLISIDNEIEAYQLAFELVQNTWRCINFDIKSPHPNLTLHEKNEIKLKNSIVYIEVIQKNPFILKQLDQIQTTGELSKNLVVVTNNNQIVSTQLININEAFQIYNNGQLIKIDVPTQSEQWHVKEIDGFKIKNKVLSLNSTSNIEKIDSATLVDAESKKASIISVGITLILVGVSFLAPKKIQNLVAEKKLSTAQSIVRMDTKKKRPKDSKPTKPATATVAQTAAPQASSNKASAIIKGAVGARISQLLSKVSATEARTQNVILTTKGVKAGQESSGRALAAVGNTESSGRNWNGESLGKGAGVGTAGVGGGRGSQGLNVGLGQGKTGGGGVGLIEEESEITGGLDREVIAQYIKTQLGQILYCYERQLSASPDLFGKIAVRFTIAGSGAVETQSINDTTLKNRSVENCILSKVARWKFPEPKGGTKVLVTYPFLFKSTN